jgi:hypothetical protein
MELSGDAVRGRGLVSEKEGTPRPKLMTALLRGAPGASLSFIDVPFSIWMLDMLSRRRWVNRDPIQEGRAHSRAPRLPGRNARPRKNACWVSLMITRRQYVNLTVLSQIRPAQPHIFYLNSQTELLLRQPRAPWHFPAKSRCILQTLNSQLCHKT